MRGRFGVDRTNGFPRWCAPASIGWTKGRRDGGATADGAGYERSSQERAVAVRLPRAVRQSFMIYISQHNGVLQDQGIVSS